MIVQLPDDKWIRGSNGPTGMNEHEEPATRLGDSGCALCFLADALGVPRTYDSIKEVLPMALSRVYIPNDRPDTKDELRLKEMNLYVKEYGFQFERVEPDGLREPGSAGGADQQYASDLSG